MSRFSSQHYVAIFMVIAGIGTQMSASHDWHEVLSPSFIGGTLSTVGGMLVAMFSPKPQKSGD